MNPLSTKRSITVGNLILIIMIAVFATLFHSNRIASAEALSAKTWDGGGTTNNWSEAANWSGDAVPMASDDVTFDATSIKTRPLTLV